MDKFERRERRIAIKEKGIHGIGTNDAWYSVKYTSDNGFGNILRCPYYSKWVSLLDSYRRNIGIDIVPEWLIFSKFLEWLYNEELSTGLDVTRKDLVLNYRYGVCVLNKPIGPSTCILITRRLDKVFNTIDKKSLYSPGVIYSLAYKRYSGLKYSVDGIGSRVGDNLDLEKSSELIRRYKQSLISKQIEGYGRRTTAIMMTYSTCILAAPVCNKVLTFKYDGAISKSALNTAIYEFITDRSDSGKTTVRNNLCTSGLLVCMKTHFIMGIELNDNVVVIKLTKYKGQ